MIRYLLVSAISGILFGFLDGVINANPIAVRAYEVYKPISKNSINFVAGMILDLLYGFTLAGLFLLLYPSLPGQSAVIKGLSFGLLAWFLRVAMNVASQWMMYKVPVKTLLYIFFTGLGEMLLIGLVYGLFLRPVD